MYYASPTPAGAASQDKSGSIYIPGQAPAPFAPAAQVGPPAGFAQQVLPNGLTAPTARYAHPQGYAVVSSPAGHPAYAPANVYSSMPYHPGMAAAIPTSSHAATAAAYHHMQAPQFHPGGIAYHHQMAALAAATTGRSTHHPPPHQPGPAPPQHYALPQPVQAGAPLFAAGYSPLPGGASTTATPPGATRTIPIGPGPIATATAGAAAFPPGFAAFPGTTSSEGTAGPQQVAYAPAGYMAQF